MKVFVAGATGAIGQPLIAELIAEGHTVTGMTHSEAGARRLRAAGVDVAIADAHNGDAVVVRRRRYTDSASTQNLPHLPRTYGLGAG